MHNKRRSWIRFARGNALLPLQDNELETKFLDCCANAELDACRLFTQLNKLETLKSIRELTSSKERASA